MSEPLTHQSSKAQAKTPTSRGYLPDTDRLSILSATILLAYALARYIDLPAREISIQLPGVYLNAEINVQTIVALLVASLTASGVNWLIRGHPARGRQTTVQHWLLPALTAWAIELPLFQLPFGPLWWVSFTLGGALLILVLIAEYIVVDPEDIRHAPAAAVLTAVSFALFLVLGAALSFAGSRLFLLLPALTLAIGLVSLRTLYLRLNRWEFVSAGVITLIIAQIAAGLHYWPLHPVTFGLLLLGPAYSLTAMAGNLAEGASPWQAILEPLIVLILIWGAAIWIR